MGFPISCFHQMETFSALLAICAGNWPVPGEFPTQRPVTWSFDVFFDLRLNKGLSKQCCGWWFETLSRPLWRHRNDYFLYHEFFYFMFCSVFCMNITVAFVKSSFLWTRDGCLSSGMRWYWVTIQACIGCRTCISISIQHRGKSYIRESRYIAV